MQIENFLDLKIAKISSSEIDTQDFKDCDIAEIEGIYPGFGFVRSLKISWRAYLKDDQKPIDVIKSKKLAKSVLGLEKDLVSSGLTIKTFETITKNQFSDWLKIYNKIIGSKQRGKINITESWLDKKSIEGGKVWGVFIYKEDTLLGGNIGTYSQNMLKVSFGITEVNDDINWGSLIDYETLKLGFVKKYKIVSFGQDTNLYGFHLSTGIFSYKARLGLTPEPIEKSGFVTTKFLSFKKFSDNIIFLSKDGEVNLIYKDIMPNPGEFQARGVTKVNIVSQQKIRILSGSFDEPK